MITARQGRQCSGRFDYIVTFGDGGFILESELAILGDGGFILENEVATLGDGGIILENEVAVLGAAGFIRVGSALVTSGLVTMAFLLALRLLIKDFFEIDIACSLFLFSTDALFYCKAHAKVREMCSERAGVRGINNLPMRFGFTRRNGGVKKLIAVKN